ncbi:MAG: hypothetical protein ABMA01_01840 [Chthoniobacteraceae bacterium]
MSIDPVFSAFLRTQRQQGLALAASSDLLQIQPEPGDETPRRYIAHFSCESLVRQPNGEIARANSFLVGIQFSNDYLRTVDPRVVATILQPLNVWHPNVNGRLICLGHLPPGTGLTEILFQIWDVLTYNRFAAHDGLNPEAMEYARQNRHLFPIYRRPLKRVTVTGGAS